MMANDRPKILALCQDAKMTDALAVAFGSKDAVGMLLVGIYDTGDLARLELLLSAEGGPALATQIVIDGIQRNNHENLITELAYRALTIHDSKLPLTNTQARALLERVPSAERPMQAADAASVLRWITHFHKREALSFARDHLAAAGITEPDQLDTAACRLLGASDQPEDHDALLDYAGRHAAAGQYASHSTIVSHLTTITDADVAQLIPQLGHYVPNNTAPGTGIVQHLERLTMDQVRACGASIPTPLTDQWFTAHFLPRLFPTHAAAFATTIDEAWWPDGALNWLLSPQAPWNEHEPVLLSQLLRSVHRRRDPARVREAHQLILGQTLAAPNNNRVRSAMPRLGARTLLVEALRGNLPPNSQELREALQHLSSDVRLDEYRAARWKQTDRAQRMAQVIAAVALAEVLQVTDELSALMLRARTAFLTEITPHLDDDLAKKLATIFQNDEQALRALVGGSAAARVVLALWEETHRLPYFRALSDTEHAPQRLDLIPTLVRDYSGHVTAAERRELLTELEVAEPRYKLLVNIIGDWGQHPSPDEATLQVALSLAAEHLQAAENPDPLVPAAEPLSRNAPLELRTAVYEAVSGARPTPALVSLLAERRRGEPPNTTGEKAVSSAIDAVAAKLVEMADSEDPRAAVQAVNLLEQLKPETALPFARRLAQSAPNAEDRITAIRILAAQGDGDTEPEILRKIAEGDEAHPDPKVRAEAVRAIRHFEIGDLEAAHELLGELSGQDPDIWTGPDHDPRLLYGSWGDALREGLDRVAKAESDENWRDAIDQLDEVAKVLLYRALEVAGPSEPSISKLVAKAQSRDLNSYGSVVGAQQLHNIWSWTKHFDALHEKRAAHIIQQGSTTPPPKRERRDFDAARVVFRDGAGPCLDLILRHTPHLEGRRGM